MSFETERATECSFERKTKRSRKCQPNKLKINIWTVIPRVFFKRCYKSGTQDASMKKLWWLQKPLHTQFILSALRFNKIKKHSKTPMTDLMRPEQTNRQQPRLLEDHLLRCPSSLPSQGRHQCLPPRRYSHTPRQVRSRELHWYLTNKKVLKPTRKGCWLCK